MRKVLVLAWLIVALAVCDRAPASPATTKRDPESSLRHLESQRAVFRDRLRAAQGKSRDRIRWQAARAIEQAMIDTVLPRWDGTDWGFYGTTIVPRSGEIACGYFVSTTLQEAGVRVERARLAQQPAEDIIKTLVPASAITRFSNVPVEQFAAATARQGDGLYLVGLDNHVGFLVVRQGEVLFHHASYVTPRKVVREPAVTSMPIVESKYRVTGKLFTDAALVEAWLEQSPVTTRVRTRSDG